MRLLFPYGNDSTSLASRLFSTNPYVQTSCSSSALPCALGSGTPAATAVSKHGMARRASRGAYRKRVGWRTSEVKL